MKPDGVTMDTTDATEPIEAAAVAEPSMLQDQPIQQAAMPPEPPENDVAPEAATKTNGKPEGADPKVKSQAVASKMQAVTKVSSGSKSQPSTAASYRNVNNTHSSTNNSPKTTSGDKTAAKLLVAGAVPRRPVGVAAVSFTVMDPTKGASKRHTGAAPLRATSSAAATAMNNTKQTTLNRRPAAENNRPVRTKSSVTVGRSAGCSAPKPSTTTASKATGGAIPKTKRPATAPSTSQAAASASRLGSTVATRPTNTAKTAPSGSRTASSTTRVGNNVASRPLNSSGTRTAASRVTTVPSTGRTTATQPDPSAAAKKDVARPPSAAAAKRPAALMSAAAKKPESSKPTTTGKPTSASKWVAVPKKADPKVCQTKSQHAKPGPTKNSGVAAPKFQAASKPLLGRTPPGSPANKSTKSSTMLSKHGNKPTQAVSPFPAVRKTKASNCAPSAQGQQGTGRAVQPARQEQINIHFYVTLPQKQSTAVPLPEEVLPQASAEDSTLEELPHVTAQSHPAASSSPHSPVTTGLPEVSQPEEQCKSNAHSSQQEQVPPPVELPSLPEISSEPLDVLADQNPTMSEAVSTAAKSVALVLTLNYDEDEEEKEASQPVSVSEMSGTTQPTSDSHPGSAGVAGGSTWKAGGAFLSELDSLSGSQQGASEFSAPGVLEGTESIDDLGDGSLKGAIDMEGASVSSPDLEKVPDIPVNDFEEDDDDDDDRVCDMDVGSERTDELQRLRHDNDVDDEEEDEDVEMASEGVTESGLESYGNADEDDFAEDERLDNLNRLAPLPPPPQLPSAPGAQWDRPNPFADPWEEHGQLQQLPEAVAQPSHVEAAVSPLVDPLQEDSETPSQSPAQAWLEINSDPCVPENPEAPTHSSDKDEGHQGIAEPLQALAPLPAGMVSSESGSPEEPQLQDTQLLVTSPQPDLVERRHQQIKAQTMPADEILRGVVTALTSNPSSSSVTEDEASDTEGEALLDDSLETPAVFQQNLNFESQPKAQCCLSTVEEAEESEMAGLTDDVTPPSATSLASYGFDSVTTASNAQSTGESCIKSPGIFSLEELPEESKELSQPTQPSLAEQQYIKCSKQEVESTEEVQRSEEAPAPSPTQSALQQLEEKVEDEHPPYYSICEKTDNSFAGLTAPPHRRHHMAHARPHAESHVAPPRLTCADLPPRSGGQQALSPQLRRLEQHQKQLLEMQQRREQQSRPLEGAEQERKRREEEEQRRKKDEAEEEIKRNEVREEAEEDEDMKRRELELQLQQQQDELKQRQQIMQWQQELEQSSKGQTVVSPSSGLCTIYEALENSDDDDSEDELAELKTGERVDENTCDCQKRMTPNGDYSSHPDLPQTVGTTSHNGDHSSPCPPDSSERPPPLDLDWGKKVDIVQQLINQTLLLNRDGCSSLLLLPGGAGGTLSPLESSLWPSLLPPITPPSATVTSVSSFSPETAGSSPQGDWTVVELETHH
ncbi:mucin-5AC [Dunckerocampus dactyliophorus]|uniref:mucin-5AC n=1 Tax=Dunckerocampus dactyliophorus TaxID=161453 RepID=UPI002406758C|nr:mucin-5AC [Dunckerocampus dactyliophorus]